MLYDNSRYEDVEVLTFLDGRTLEAKDALDIRAPITYEQDDTSRVHVIDVGDDLFTIATIYYGDASLWWVIADNNITLCDDPFNMNVGDELFIPKINF